MFVILTIFIWLDEVLDIPHVVFRRPATPINWFEALFESSITAVVGIIVVLQLIEDARRMAKATRALKESETNLSQIVQGSSIPIFVIDSQHTVTHWNHACEVLTNVSAKEIVGTQEAWKALYKQKRALLADLVVDKRSNYEIKQQYNAAKRSKLIESAYEAEAFLPYLEKQGKWLFFTVAPLRDEDGQLFGAIETIQDITERKESEKRIKHLNEVLRTIRNVNQLITKEKNPDKLISGACKELAKTRGFFNAWISLFDEEGQVKSIASGDTSKKFSSIIKMLKEGEKTKCQEMTSKKDGIVLIKNPVKTCKGCPLLPEYKGRSSLITRLKHNGKTYGTITLILPKNMSTDKEEQNLFKELSGDISYALYSIEIEKDREKGEKALKTLNERLKRRGLELERSNKELEQFAYVASHDLQEPLRMVASYTQLLEKRYKDKLDDNAGEFIGFAVDGANRMQKLINALLSYSRVGTRGKAFEPTDSHSALGQAITNLNITIKENNAIVTNDDLPNIMADESQLVQLFQNLIGNAIKFRSKEQPHIHISAQNKGREWLFSVKDNGIGFAPEYKDRIFVIFQRLNPKDKYPGTGMGLAICKKIVERHNGRIWVDSEPAKGSTFYFTIPKGGKK
jgi:PAS domain S-box-containing protein